ncbi:MAG: RsmE family RNA methyltransferase, partial [Pseudomonadota bacterium]
HSQRHHVNHQHLERIVIEAAEQCERLDIPKIEDVIKFDQIFNNQSPHQKIFIAMERSAHHVTLKDELKNCGIGQSVKKSLKNETEKKIDQVQNMMDSLEIALLIGPEGGFSQRETLTIKASIPASTVCLPNRDESKKNAVFSIGCNILRTETAAIASLTLLNDYKYQLLC